MVGAGPVGRNVYFHNTLEAMGGSELQSTKSYAKKGRYGGGLVDSILYLKNFDRLRPIQANFKSTRYYCDKIFGTGAVDSINLCHPLLDIYEPDVPGDTSPGITYRRLGFRSKAEALPLAVKYLEGVYDRFEKDGKLRNEDIFFPWCVGGRPKLTQTTKAMKKVVGKLSVGRSIWISDIEEAILTRRYTKHIDRRYSGNALKHSIMVNFDKNRHSLELKGWVDKYDWIIEADYTKFDSSLSSEVMGKALKVFKSLFTNLTPWDEAIFEKIEFYLKNSAIDCGNGTLVQKSDGLPSGSGLTSILGSICNYIMLDDCLSFDHNKEWGALVYGDDCLIGLKDKAEGERQSAATVKRKLMKRMSDKFGIKLSEEETKLTDVKYVTIAIPVFEGDTSLGTSTMKPVKFNYQRLPPEEGNLVGHTSHRWSYFFGRTWKFLGYSMLLDGTMLRPAYECFERLYNPERNIKSWDEHFASLKMILFENFENLHVRNRVMHYMLDAWWVMERRGFSSSLPDIDKSKSMGRAFYRYERGYVSLREVEEYQSFFMYFDDLIESLRSARDDKQFEMVSLWKLKRNRNLGAVYDVGIGNLAGDMNTLRKCLGIANPGKLKTFQYSRDSFAERPTLVLKVLKLLDDRFWIYNGEPQLPENDERGEEKITFKKEKGKGRPLTSKKQKKQRKRKKQKKWTATREEISSLLSVISTTKRMLILNTDLFSALQLKRKKN